jgi:predicted DNA-binding protein (UPF0251 family)
MSLHQRITLTLLVTIVGGSAFTLSFDAQLALATGSGIRPTIAGLYPLVVDVAILTGVLIRIWNPDHTTAVTRYLWAAIAFWSITNILGNAFHVTALPQGRITVPTPLAIAVNTVPALTLFIVIHVATLPSNHRTITPTAQTETTRRSPKPLTAVETKLKRTDLPELTDAELLAMADGESMSLQQIADRVGRSKSYIGNRVKNARDKALAEAAPAA